MQAHLSAIDWAITVTVMSRNIEVLIAEDVPFIRSVGGVDN